ncbi:MAG: hypothetical protein EP326_04020 [Deltaproteobacteria bacterium]|nr:MAG: hypothetical protein EP326_04020 [Deltaproteobacteria bacterium]TNF24534.1 MAG: hypothetical protein EP319_18205 [Deltaproteobacteria bacterium]
MEDRQYSGPYHDQTSFDSLKERIKKQGFMGIRIISDSMDPFIQVGEEVTVSEFVNNKQLQRFTPILYWDGKKLVCHYFWNQSRIPNADGKQTIVTRSLKQTKSNDVPVPIENILGIVVGRKLSAMKRISILLSNIFSSTG